MLRPGRSLPHRPPTRIIIIIDSFIKVVGDTVGLPRCRFYKLFVTTVELSRCRFFTFIRVVVESTNLVSKCENTNFHSDHE